MFTLLDSLFLLITLESAQYMTVKKPSMIGYVSLKNEDGHVYLNTTQRLLYYQCLLCTIWCNYQQTGVRLFYLSTQLTFRK